MRGFFCAIAQERYGGYLNCQGGALLLFLKTSSKRADEYWLGADGPGSQIEFGCQAPRALVAASTASRREQTQRRRKAMALFAPQDRLRLTNEDAVNALAFAPPRGAWSVDAHAHFPPALRKRCAHLLKLKPAHVPNVCWLRVLTYALDAREAEPLLASAAGNAVQLWRGGAPAGRLRGHMSIVRAVAFAPRGDALATAALDETVRIWRRVDPARRRAAKTKIRSDASGSSPRRSRSAGPPTRRSALRRAPSPAVSDTSTGVSDGELPCRARAGSFGDQKGACVVCGVRDAEPAVALPCCGQRCHRACLQRWVALAPDAPLPREPRAQRSVAFDDDEAEPTWACTATLRHGCDVLSVVLSDQYCVSGARDGGVRVWAPREDDWICLHEKRAPPNDETDEQWGAVRCLAFSDRCARVWAGSDDGYVRQFAVGSGTLLLRFRAHASRLYDVAFSPEMGLLASCGQDQYLRLWSGDQLLVHVRHDAWVHGVAFAPGGRLLATACADLTVNLVFYVDKDCLRECGHLKRHEGAVTCVAFAPLEDGGGLASGSVDGTIALWRRLAHDDTDATDSD